MSDKKVVIVSGGSKGLGQGIVSQLLDAGYCVATFSRGSSDFIKEMQKASKGKIENLYWEPVDAGDFESLARFCKTVYNKFGRIDALINNAGISREGILTTMPPKTISEIIKINLESAIQLTRVCSKYFMLSKSGVIVNISSINGIRGHTGVAVYGATKAALDGLTRGLAHELGECNIRINSIAPGYLETEMTQGFSETQKKRIIRRTPMGRLGMVQDIANLAIFLLSEQANFITGQTIVVDGGFTC